MALPLIISVLNYAKNNSICSGSLSLAKLEQLASLLPKQTAQINASLQFGFDEAHRIVINLTIQAKLTLECQRSLEVYQESFDINTRLSPIEHLNDADSLPTEYEPVLLEDGCFCPKDIISDELILALPIIPKQPDSICIPEKNPAYCQPSKIEPDALQQPFAELAGLKFDQGE